MPNIGSQQPNLLANYTKVAKLQIPTMGANYESKYNVVEEMIM